VIKAEYNDFCSGLIGTSHVVQWGGADVWKVGGKMFAVAWWDGPENPAITFKPSEGDFYFLQDEEGFRPAPYMASRGLKWLQIYQLTAFDDGEIKSHIQQSHRIVSLGLSKKLQKELNLNQDQ